MPATDARRLWAARYGAGGDPAAARLHIAPGAGHVGAYQSNPDAYLATVLAFWREVLPPGALPDGQDSVGRATGSALVIPAERGDRDAGSTAES
ncbi:MAG: hypothetical protein U0232_01750 [Thermomicrobiales bacterium]